jgi:16S rRNA (uracil1498-N3)-methyltransferase
VRSPRNPDTLFWVEPDAVEGDRLTLAGDESHHLLRVHRVAPGAPFTAIDGGGVAYECVLESAERGVAVGRIARREPGMGEPPVPITLLVGLPDAGPTETVVEHAVPLGATAIDFFAAARSGRAPLAPARLERLLRIARAALKQSRRCRLPILRSSPSLEVALGSLEGGRRYVADPAGRRPTLEGGDRGQAPVILAVGPPGDFDDAEKALLRRSDFSPISLVENRLTTETAAVAILALARNLFI